MHRVYRKTPPSFFVASARSLSTSPTLRRWFGTRNGTALLVAAFAAASALCHCADNVPYYPELTDRASTALHYLRRYDAILYSQINDAQ